MGHTVYRTGSLLTKYRNPPAHCIVTVRLEQVQSSALAINPNIPYGNRGSSRQPPQSGRPEGPRCEEKRLCCR